MRYGGNRYVKSFPCLLQFLCMAFAQLAYRESLRHIEVCLRAQRNQLYHLGTGGKIALGTATDLYMILKIPSLALFEKIPLFPLFSKRGLHSRERRFTKTM